MSEHVYCEPVTFKITEWVEQWICIRFCIKLEHSSAETIWMMLKGAAMGNWWSAASSQCGHSMHHVLCRVFWGKNHIILVIQPPCSLDLAPWKFWLSPKLKSPLKGKRFQTADEIQENTMGQLTVTGRTVWDPKVPTLKVTEASLSYVQCFFCLQ